ncbi:MAG: hypothetical protein M5U15_08180 [Kiritimatiellae bacterium]|nr:hypothetical protein [Kiritimatiellia bacterium]
MKMLSFFIGTAFTLLVADSFGGPLNALDNSEVAVAENFADAIQDKDVVLGVFEVPDDGRPTVLPSGDILENIPGYSEALLRSGLCLLKTVESLHGDAPAFVFVSQLPVRVEHEPYEPFVALPGSRWILALQKHAADIAMVGGLGEKHEAIDVVEQNTLKLFNGSRGAACLRWPNGKGVEQPCHVVNINSTALDDIKRIRNHRAAQKGTPNKPTGDIDNLQELLKSKFGKAMHQRMVQ